MAGPPPLPPRKEGEWHRHLPDPNVVDAALAVATKVLAIQSMILVIERADPMEAGTYAEEKLLPRKLALDDMPLSLQDRLRVVSVADAE